ncbi:MAG: hypothetical protein RQ752_02670 [Thermohalobaculum sp.]|nr:hypothetical protein [Thermohalobaculum sp.]
MELVADGLLFLTALTTGLYCFILAGRLRRFGRADEGIGEKIQALSTAIEETRGALGQTQARLDDMRREAQLSGERITRETARARRLTDDLAAAAADAEKTLDALYRADRRVQDGLAAAPGAASLFEGVEIEAGAPAGPAGETLPDPGADDDFDMSSVPRASEWAGGDVLKVERMTL